jgi:hypothetical protein
MHFCQLLKRLQRIRNHQKITSRQFFAFELLKLLFADHKIAHAPCIQFGNVTRTVVPFGSKCKEQGFFRKTQRTAVCQQPVNGGRHVSYASGTCHLCYIFNRV